MTKIIKSLKSIITDLIIKLARRKMILNFDEYCVGEPTKKALLTFLAIPLLLPPVFRDRVRFSLRGMAQEIPRVLNELGYRVDVVNFDNISWKPKEKYDLFIGHGGINFEKISRSLPKEVIRIYLSTGIYWKEWNFRIAKRLYDVALRQAFLLKPERFIKYSEEYANKNSDAIICLGNQEAVKTYSNFKNVFGINTAFYPIKKEIEFKKNFATGRQHFLFFSGGGNVHKGLDLLLESFNGMNLHLHVCQTIQDDFFKLYSQELTQLPNIHMHGFIKMRSEQFIRLINKCNWVISASCAEGQPGAIVECMAYGLIPILSDWNNIDLENWGIRLENCNLLTIRSVLEEVSTMDVEECRLRSEAVIKTVKQKYSVQIFRENLSKALKEILNVSPPKN